MTPRRKQKILQVLDKRQPDITIVMEDVRDPHNIAAVMRSCDAIGVTELYIIKTKLPTRKRWGNKSSSSANKWLTIHTFKEVESCFSAVRKKYDRILTTHLSQEAEDLYKIDFTKSIALVFGNEKDGVSREAVDLADGNLIIPQMGMISSLNISVACAVTLYEAYRQKKAAGHYKERRLPDTTYEEMKKGWGVL